MEMMGFDSRFYLSRTEAPVFIFGGDDGIRLSRELRAQSFAGKTRPPEEFFTRLLLRIPLFFKLNRSSRIHLWWR